VLVIAYLRDEDLVVPGVYELADRRGMYLGIGPTRDRLGNIDFGNELRPCFEMRRDG
jgi:hypothetical protein